MQPAKLFDRLDTRTQEQMIGIPEYDAGADLVFEPLEPYSL